MFGAAFGFIALGIGVNIVVWGLSAGLIVAYLQ